MLAFQSSSGKKIDYRLGIVFGATTLPGAVAGSLIGLIIADPIFNLLLGTVISALAFLMLFSSSFQGIRRGDMAMSVNDLAQAGTHHINQRIAMVVMAFLGLVIGTFGAGGGLMLLPVLLWLGFPIRFALGTGRFILVILTIGATLARLFLLQVDIAFGLILSFGTVTGGYLGARLLIHLDETLVRDVAAVMVLVLGLILILQV